MAADRATTLSAERRAGPGDELVDRPDRLEAELLRVLRSGDDVDGRSAGCGQRRQEHADGRRALRSGECCLTGPAGVEVVHRYS